MHVIATAGHVDHGKSTLVRALTGMEPDRSAEESRRGLTIDLGYAWTTLPGGAAVAFVDVPGHQRFISNMLAGIGPVPAVLFVVAADAGWSAQSAEHLQALDALQIRHGVLAITRADLGDAELAEAEARDYLTGTTLAQIEAVAVSPVTGVGLDQLRGALSRMAARIPPAPGGRTRLWVDRVFTIRGAGTVVTGTLSSGAIATGDRLALHPSGETVRVRGLQSLQEEIPRADAVARVAINLRGVPRARVHRGDALTRPDEWRDVATLDVRLSEVIRLPEEMIFHIGSAAVPARVRRLGADTARLTLTRPVVTALGERGILRDPGARRILAVVVLDPAPPPLTRRRAARRRAEQLATMDGSPDLAGEVSRRGVVRQAELMLIGTLDARVAPPPGVVAAGDWLVTEDRWQEWSERLPFAVDAWAHDHPSQPGMTPAALAQVLDLPDPAVVAPLLAGDATIVLDQDGVHRRGVRATLNAEAADAVEQVRARLALDPFNALEAGELEAVGLTDRDLAMAVAEGRLLRISERIYLLPDAIEQAVRALSAIGEPFTVSRAREALGATRRTVLPLLELLDRRRRTRRIDDHLREVVSG